MPLKLAIVGRPNVGKSTLFNRLAGKKLAIVDDRPGVTRDRRYAAGRLGDIDLQLIDTAGFEDVDDESLEARMRRQTELAVEEADLVLFVIDAREGVVPLDRIFADLLRRRDKPVVMIANKAEGRAGEHGIGEGHALGFGEPIGLSAEHGEGLADLYAAVLATAPVIEDDEDDDVSKPVMVAIIGRPNAGKSTLINRLIGQDRMLTGPEAGITRDSISVDFDFDGRPVRLIDTAGMRRKARIEQNLEKLSVSDTIRAITFAEVVVLVMDQADAFDTQDLRLADLVEREGRALVYCLAKWDTTEEPQARLKHLQETADEALPQLRGSPFVALSARTGWQVDRLMPSVLKAHRNWSAKVKTKDLNDWLALAVQRHPPPAVDGRRIKPKYMAQLKGRPPTFVLMANRASQMPESYRRYLINSLRESFDLPGVPIRITLKSGANPYAEGGDRARPINEGKPGSRKIKTPEERAAQSERAKMLTERRRAAIERAEAGKGPMPKAAKPKTAQAKHRLGKLAAGKTPSRPKSTSAKPAVRARALRPALAKPGVSKGGDPKGGGRGRR